MAGQSKWGYPRRTRASYNLPFRLQVFAEVKSGEITYTWAQRKYGIQGRSTVLVWLRKHGRSDWGSSQAMNKRTTPARRIQDLEKKLKRLEAEKEILYRAIDLADRELEADIRKKYLALLSEASSRHQQRTGRQQDRGVEEKDPAQAPCGISGLPGRPLNSNPATNRRDFLVPGPQSFF